MYYIRDHAYDITYGPFKSREDATDWAFDEEMEFFSIQFKE